MNSSTAARATGPRAPNQNAQKAPWVGIWPSRAVGACPRAIPQARGIVPSDLFSTNEHYMYACAGSAQWFMHAWTRQWTLMACSSCACAVLTLYYMLHMPWSLPASSAPANTTRMTQWEGQFTCPLLQSASSDPRSPESSLACSISMLLSCRRNRSSHSGLQSGVRVHNRPCFEGATVAVSRCRSHTCEERGMSCDRRHHCASFDVRHACGLSVGASLKCSGQPWCHAG